ncbi:uncharacterized protein LOC110862288 [Folsomia candida]|uniref:Uncharacterized protein n=1 Tax=Folsomia candida TaxID=158441 RepID=A0A226D070_FOLCA|nr:uncharacterized protein LOC110862288 [Folsomia candida]OXA37686.1 hypothetical protein Fcan01_27547 [Folsomia candida]
MKPIYVFTLILYFSGQDLCNGEHILCKIGQELCGRRCYNSTILKCLNNSTVESSILCGTNELACGKGLGASCFNPNSKVCYTSKKRATGNTPVELVALCDKNEKACNTLYWLTCYNPELFACLLVTGKDETFGLVETSPTI